VTALLNLLGPVSGITAGAGIAIPRRVVGKGPRAGESITVTTPDHVCAVLETAGGAIGTLTTSFAAAHPPYDREFPITIYGEEGTLRVPDPNLFDGRVLYRRVADEEWIEAPHTFVAGYGRSVGLADLACAVRSGRAHRVTAAGALAALEVMLGSLEAAATGKRYLPPTPYSRPVPMPAELPFGTLDW
jgi:predicted dehydrogenase